MVSHFSLFEIEADELCVYLANKCAASATIVTIVGSAKAGSKESLVVQV